MPPSISRASQLVRPATLVLLAWTIFFVLWALFMLGYVGVPIGDAIRSGIIATTLSASFSFFVWKFTASNPWPERVHAVFFLSHVATGFMFTVLWTWSGPILGITIYGGEYSEIEWGVAENAWRLLMGVWLYCILIGLSYALRNSRRLRDQAVITARAEVETARALAEASSARAEAMDARLKSLRAQLHPHFLFNALHSVSSLIREDRDAAENAIEQLGDLLRYAIQERKNEFVPVSEEWKFSSDYIALQLIRYGDQLTADAFIETAIRDELIPVFTIQPLIENAIVHGALTDGRDAHINIRLVGDDSNLILTVIDNGALKKSASNSAHLYSDHTGSGITVLRERLERLCGTATEVSLSVAEDGSTIASIRLPRTSLPSIHPR